MTGGGRRRPAKSSSSADPDALDSGAAAQRAATKGRDRHRSSVRQIKSFFRTRLGLALAAVVLVALGAYFYRGAGPRQGSELKRVVTPLDAPKMMDLPQFQGEHKESLYWGTYRPHVYLGIRARTPKSLIAGLMWLGIKNEQYFLRHVCQDSDDLKTYGWLEHNGRNYGRQVMVDQDLILTTSFIKSKGIGSGYGGDWAVRINVENEKTSMDESPSRTVHTFFYVADEEGNALNLDKVKYQYDKSTILTFGSRKDIGFWELHMASMDDAEIHYSGFRTPHMHNLTELLQAVLAVNARKTGLIQLPDTSEDASNVIFFQMSVRCPSQVDIAFLSGTGVEGSNVKERIENLTGTLLSSQLSMRERQHHEDYMARFNLSDKVDFDSAAVGKAAIGNLLGGMGYFYGQSRIALPKDISLQNGDKFLLYWPAALFTAVPSRPFFPRGFLWDEGFHQLLVWQWDIDICLDAIGHWLDLMNVEGWIPREQILGAEALSKVPEEFVLQHPTNGNPPTLFLVLRDIASKLQENVFSETDRIKIFSFLERAYVRLEAWFHWYNNTQSGKGLYTYYWHGRDTSATRELNPKSLMSGLDDYPRASHPSEDERHIDLRCWMLLAADSMHSISVILGRKDGLNKGFEIMAKHLSDFEILNQMHLDETSGAYFDFGNHTEKVRLKWFDVRDGDLVRRDLLREVMEEPRLSLVPHFGYVSLFPFIMGIIPPDSWVFERHLQLISNKSTLWTQYGLRSLSRTSSLYMKWNTQHDGPYWRGQIWINMNYLILSALNRYSQYDGAYQNQTKSLYNDLRRNLIRNVVRNYRESGYLWEQYDPKGKGQKSHPFTGWTALIVLIMSESYPKL